MIIPYIPNQLPSSTPSIAVVQSSSWPFYFISILFAILIGMIISKKWIDVLPNRIKKLFNLKSSPSLIQVHEEILGHGSHGTMVYKGTFNGRPVAVKRMLVNFYDIVWFFLSFLYYLLIIGSS